MGTMIITRITILVVCHNHGYTRRDAVFAQSRISFAPGHERPSDRFGDFLDCIVAPPRSIFAEHPPYLSGELSGDH